MGQVEFIILVDDVSVNPAKIKEVNGLSIYIEAYNKMILFDTGPDPTILEENSEILNVDLSLLDCVIISHIHSDHIGGIPYVGWVSPSVKAYIPYASGNAIESYIKKNGLVPYEVLDWYKISNNIYLSKPFYGPPWEHFLILKTRNGLVVVSGSGHPDMVSVLREIREYYNDEIYAFIGGIYLRNAPDKIIYKTIDEIIKMVSLIAPLHNIGERAKNYIAQKYLKKLVKAFAGSILRFPMKQQG